MKPSIRYTRRIDGVKLAYSIFGEGSVLLCPAGWVTNLAFFIEDPAVGKFFNSLSQRYSIIFYDKHGCGQSDRDRTEFTLESELLDLETIVDSLKLAKFSIFGISMAGATSIAYATRNPEKIDKLILYGAYANGKLLAPEKVQTAMDSLVRASWGIGSKALSDIFLPDAPSEARKGFIKFQRESATAEVAASLLSLAYSIDVTEFLPILDFPTLVLHRKEDKTIPINHGQMLAQEIQNAQFRVLNGKLHFPWLGDTKEVIDEILNFLGEGKTANHFNETVGVSADESEIVEQTTIMFTDIVSSTELVAEIGDANARNLFAQHDNIIRELIDQYDGKELQNLGDGFMLAFPSATYAIHCACAFQNAISQNLPQIKVKIGINTGEVVIREGKHPFGQAVVIASRIVEECAGQQILISDISRGLAAGSKFTFSEIGKFKPKGLDYSINLFEVVWSD
jgi:class 3 adenylate cyclase/pimeloyl-ACP methyl ester carboxylesterase